MSADLLTIDPADPMVITILGQPNFACGPIASAFRRAGQAIPRRAEDEQAAVILWMLKKYAEHGEQWQDKANEEIKALVKSFQPKEEAEAQ